MVSGEPTKQSNFLNRSEPSSPMIRAQSPEEMKADLELVNLGKENLGGEEEGSPLFKRPSSLCVKTPVSLAPCYICSDFSVNKPNR